MAAHQHPIDELAGSCFEENFLARTLGAIAEDADMALTELVANAWDAGASLVDLTIPEAHGGTLVVEDDGHGMTSDQFRERWMTLGYDRLKRQGPEVEFPLSRRGWRRCAYGRAGVGRHGLLCFADRYTVDTWREGQGTSVDISTSAGSGPFGIDREARFPRDAQGTCVAVIVERRLPDVARVRQHLAASFIHDPQFIIRVNGEAVTPADLGGGIDRIELRTGGRAPAATFHVMDLTRAGRGPAHAGLSLWVNGRKVGTPDWRSGGEQLIDPCGPFAKRYAIVVDMGPDWLREVHGDWRRMRDSPPVDALNQAIRRHVQDVLDRWGRTISEENSEATLTRHLDAFEKLSLVQRAEVAAFTRELVKATPAASQELLSAAVLAAIRVQGARGGSGLLDRLAALGDSDIEGLSQLLSQWTVRNALTVLDEVDHRMAVITLLEKLSADPGTDELQVLHPLVTQARWLFGAEFDSSEYASNLSLRTAAEKIFKKRLPETAFPNHRKRPDLLMLSDATCSIVGTEGFGPSDDIIIRHQNVLVVELKRGGHVLERVDLYQALGYLDDFYRSGAMDCPAQLSAFVVGHTIAEEAARELPFVAGGVMRGKVQAVTYGQLTRSAHRRLLRIKDKLPARYEDLSGADLSAKVMRVATADA